MAIYTIMHQNSTKGPFLPVKALRKWVVYAMITANKNMSSRRNPHPNVVQGHFLLCQPGG
ncbi:hypothetical protein KSX_11650 [Ktedonospora formicarum]|uniref:Uncharacterized protein n=1 Tax=Ktedonospora formicarum TaxID=2778364 RepID=A0A8J3MNP8_9CHLR|nr:hypothetical protein KSX_11650 [Ktedonospora formicarum]